MRAVPFLARFLLLVVLAATASLAVVQGSPGDASPNAVNGEDAALDCIALRYAGTPLSLDWVEPEGPYEASERGVYAVRWLTPAGNVIDIRVSDAACRFLLIEGVGQVEARIGP